MAKRLLGNERIVAVNELCYIADRVGLGPTDKNRFIKFALAWYNDTGKRLWSNRNVDGLAWAELFLEKMEYYTDIAQGCQLKTLIKVDGLQSARSRLAKQIILHGGWESWKAQMYAQKLTKVGTIY